MSTNKSFVAISSISAAGILYSGYLTDYTLTTKTSACELFYFGLPSCFYGFLLYFAILALSFGLWLRQKRSKSLAALFALSVAGTAFSGTLTAYMLSLRSCLASSLTIFGIPPCVLGLAMFTLVFVISTIRMINTEEEPTKLSTTQEGFIQK